METDVTIEETQEEELKEAEPSLPQIDTEVMKVRLPALLEAMIFASPEPLTLSKIVEVFDKKDVLIEKSLIKEALLEVEARWQTGASEQAGGLELVQVAGGFIFRTRSEFGPVLRGLYEEKPIKLSQAQLEALSIIAYRQPITRIEIEEIRGVDCSASMRKLLNLKLVKILGKSEGLGRPLLYGTTKYFLEFFGLNSLHDLPTLKEYQDLDKDQEKGQDDSSNAPITVRDLFASTDSLLSEKTEQMSIEALKSLDAALGIVDHTMEKIAEDNPEKEGQ